MSMTISVHNSSKTNGGGSLAHNQRYGTSLKYRGHIDQERKKLNYVYAPYRQRYGNDPKNQIAGAYEEIFGKAIEEFNDTPGRRTREKTTAEEYMQKCQQKIKNRDGGITETRQYRELILQIGSLEDTGYLKGNKKQAQKRNACKEALRQTLKAMQKKFPNMKIVCAAIHADEQGGIHMHVNYIPVATQAITRNGKITNGMRIRNDMKNALKEMGVPVPDPKQPEGRYNNRYITWQDNIREIIKQKAKEQGLETHYQKSRVITDIKERIEQADSIKKHKSTLQYKLEQSEKLEKEFREAEENIVTNRFAAEQARKEVQEAKKEVIEIKNNINVAKAELAATETELDKRYKVGNILEKLKEDGTLDNAVLMQDLRDRARERKDWENMLPEERANYLEKMKNNPEL